MIFESGTILVAVSSPKSVCSKAVIYANWSKALNTHNTLTRHQATSFWRQTTCNVNNVHTKTPRGRDMPVIIKYLKLVQAKKWRTIRTINKSKASWVENNEQKTSKQKKPNNTNNNNNKNKKTNKLNDKISVIFSVYLWSDPL